jgi:hypothetical protein
MHVNALAGSGSVRIETSRPGERPGHSHFRWTVAAIDGNAHR